MEMNLKKIWPLVGAMCVTMVGSAFADTYSAQSNDSMQQASSSQGSYQRGTYREITPPAGPRVAHGADVAITADFIWWKATQEGVSAGITGYSADSSSHDTTAGKKWAPGFKVGLGLNLGHDGWDVMSQYTWLHADNTHKTSSNHGVGMFGEQGKSAKTDWQLHFNVIDVELGRNFYVSQYLTLRPFFGLKGTWQEQDVKSNLFHTATNENLKGHSHQDHWGLGIRGGLNTSWYLTKSLSIYGSFALANMWSDYNKNNSSLTKQDDEGKLLSTEGNSSAKDTYSTKHLTELELGLCWETWFYDDNYHLAVQAGWEQQVWSGWTHFAGLGSHDLNLHGLSLKLRFDF